jgi:integrase
VPPQRIKSLLVSLLYYLAVRRDEIRLLKKHDIVYKQGCLYFTVTGKGNKTRTIPLSRSKTALIQPLLNTITNGYIFKGRFGGPLSKSGIHNIMKRVASRMQKPCISCHWLRHACESYLLDAKATLVQVRDHLAHSNVVFNRQ